MSKQSWWVTGAILLGAALCPAQEEAPLAAVRSGLRIHGASSYVGYSSLAFPNRGGFLLGDRSLGWEVSYGGSATVGWTRPGAKTSLSLIYTPSYTGRARYTEWNAVNHAGAFWLSRKLNSKLDLSLSAAVSSSNLENHLFAPTVFQQLLDVPVTFEDLANAMVAGRYTNNQLASLLTGAPLLESAARTLIYGDRVFSASSKVTLGYQATPRLSVHASAGASRNYHQPGGSQSDPDPLTEAFYISGTSSLNANAGLGYSLTPRTQIGFGVSANRNLSTVYDGYTATASGSIARKMGRRWFAHASAGVGKAYYGRQLVEISSRPTWVSGAGVGFSHYSHTLVASYSRSAGDAFGLGANASTAVTGAWQWGRPGRFWKPWAAIGYNRYHGGAVNRMEGWMASAGLSRALTRTTGLSLSYAYLSNRGEFLGVSRQISAHSVRLTLGWSPVSEGL
jgi:hypothetical protein